MTATGVALASPMGATVKAAQRCKHHGDDGDNCQSFNDYDDNGDNDDDDVDKKYDNDGGEYVPWDMIICPMIKVIINHKYHYMPHWNLSQDCTVMM